MMRSVGEPALLLKFVLARFPKDQSSSEFVTIDTTKSSTHYRNELLVQHNRTMSRSEHEWTFEHSIVCAVDAQFAWNFWTTVSNWALDKDVESIDIDGPFAAGTRGVT